MLALSLAACGSQLDPDEVADASGGTGGTTAQGGEVVPGTGTDGGRPPAAVTRRRAAARRTGGRYDHRRHRHDRRWHHGSGTGGGAGGGQSGGGGGGDDGRRRQRRRTAAAAAPAATASRTAPGSPTPRSPSATPPTSPARCPASSSPRQDAVKAYVAYFNSTSDICGRKLKLVTYDSRTDAGADQQNYAKGCDEVFAMVGSMSAFDSGGAATAQSCGLPDIRSAAVTRDRNACTTCFPAQSVNTGEWENAPGEFIKQNYPDAVAHAGLLYLNAGAAAENGPVEASAMTKQGLHFDVVQGIDVAEFNYAPYAQALKDKGVKVVFCVGAYQQSVRLAQAMQQVGYKPDIYLRDPTDYIPELRRDRRLRRRRHRGLPQLRAVRGGRPPTRRCSST